MLLYCFALSVLLRKVYKTQGLLAFMAKEGSQDKSKNRKILLWAAIAGLIIVFLFIFGSIPNYFMKNLPGALHAYSLILNILNVILSCIFLLGFYYLGKIYNKKFLRIIIILFVAFALITLLIQIFYVDNRLNSFSRDLNSSIVASANTLGIDSSGLTQEQSQAVSLQAFKDTAPKYVDVLVLLIAYAVLYILFVILWGVGILKLKDNVGLARTTGILKIVAGSTIILVGIGLLINAVAFVFELIILFQEANKK
jgi:small-conductance mechanosensitive channel